jgi:hypothetical protein
MGQPLWPEPIQTKPFLSLALWEIVKRLKVFHFAPTWKGKSQFHVIKEFYPHTRVASTHAYQNFHFKINIFLNTSKKKLIFFNFSFFLKKIFFENFKMAYV